MYNVSQLLSDRVARERLHRRQRAEAERRERVFNDKVRTIGVRLHFTPTVITGTNGSNILHVIKCQGFTCSYFVLAKKNILIVSS